MKEDIKNDNYEDVMDYLVKVNKDIVRTPGETFEQFMMENFKKAREEKEEMKKYLLGKTKVPEKVKKRLDSKG